MSIFPYNREIEAISTAMNAKIRDIMADPYVHLTENTPFQAQIQAMQQAKSEGRVLDAVSLDGRARDLACAILSERLLESIDVSI